MKKNPLHYNNSPANKLKIAYAKRLRNLSMIGLFVIALITTLSIDRSASAKDYFKCVAGSVMLCTIVPFAAGVRGTKAANGADESEAEFTLRAGKPEADEVYAKRYLKYLEQEISVLKDKPDLKAELEALKTKIEGMANDSTLLQNLKKEIEKSNLAIEAMKESGKSGDKKEKTINEQIEEWFTKSKEKLALIKSGTKAELEPMRLKVNSPMTPANTFSATTYLPQVQYLPGVTEIVRVEPTFWDYIKKGRSASATLVWVNKYTPSGAADFIAPGVAKPGVSFKLQSETSNAKKVAASAKCTTELLEDIPGMQSFIEQELTYQLKYHLNQAVMSSTVSSTDIQGIQGLSTTYTLTTVATTNPNNWDAIIACVAQLRSGNLHGPVTAFVNPVDYANMILTKATSQGQLFVPAQSGVMIVEDNNVAVGYLQIGLIDYYKIAIYKDMEITFGWENDDFTKNLVTAIIETRIHQWFSANNTGAFIYDTFANIKNAIGGI